MKRSFLFITLLALSCSKQELAELSNTKQIDFSYYGTEHNAMLDLVDSLITDLPSSTSADRLSAASSYVSPIFGNLPSSGIDEIEDGMNRIEYITSTVVYGGSYLNEIGLIDDYEVIIAYNSVDSLLLSMEEQAVLNSNWYTPTQFNTEIDKLIQSVSSNVQYDSLSKTGNDRALFIANMEIAKSSYEYWFAAASNIYAPWGEYFEINSANKTTASVFKKIWMAIKRTAVDIWAFPSCPYCGGISPDPSVEPTPYDLGQAGNYAGEQSSQVE